MEEVRCNELWKELRKVKKKEGRKKGKVKGRKGRTERRNGQWRNE